ncbi:MAG: alpha/beta hydrolase [Desulfobacteraceae bacterium]|jgi:acetyl esterase|nr:alpha/beta hydrolase [Desulfobacteraceae bacterium]
MIDKKLLPYVEEMTEFNIALLDMEFTPPRQDIKERIKTSRENVQLMMSPPVPEAEARVIETTNGDIPARIFIPNDIKGIYLDIHGGGWITGAPQMNDAHNLAIANEVNVAVVSIDYRLAPENSFPAAPDDCEAAALWILENGMSEFGSDSLLIGGASAGGHLAVETLIRLRDRHDATSHIKGANLVYGIYDLSMTPSQRDTVNKYPVLNKSDLEFSYDMFLPDVEFELRRDPKYSPLFADLSNMPPAIFTIGMLDMLLDDTLFMAARWEAAGNHADLAAYPESPHGFNMFPTKMAEFANRRIIEFLKNIINT